MNDLAIDWQSIRTTFRQIWGYENFRSPQEDVIRTLLTANDALIIMPTGGGKSICFQLPALLQTGTTLVVSPLVALMENQVQQLCQRHLSAALLHNELPQSQRKKTLQAIEKQQLRLLYLSPETLLSQPVWERLSHPQFKVNGLILDEAHCLVQWGLAFRPAYRRLGAVRSTLLKSKPPNSKIAIAAFTATADAASQKIIADTLQLRQPECFLVSPYRNNLYLNVKIVWTPKCRRHQLLKFLRVREGQTGLIYVRTRRASEELAQWLSSLDYSTVAYHAGLSPQQRRFIEGSWLSGNTQFVVCTSAFGMGIDKSDVRWIVHFQAPVLLSEYLQEVGRGGRDGRTTDALTLISEPTGWLDSEDKSRDRFFLNQLQKQYRQARQIMHKLPSQGNINAISQQFPQGEIALSLLHGAGQLEWLDPFHYRLNFQKSPHSQTLFNLQARSQRLMRQYLTTRQCRWQFLLNAFGFTQEATGFKCGHCDNCR